jgi:hypothetical protein
MVCVEKPPALAGFILGECHFQFYIDIHSPKNTADIVVSKVKEHVFPMLAAYKPGK